MEELDEEIVRLERRLAELQAKRDHPEWRGPDKENQNHGDPFVVASEDDLTLGSMSDLVRSILDALPVSVFVKFAKDVPKQGRRFTYINKLARERLAWEARDVPTHFDSEAFLNRWESPLYQQMLRQETNTLDGKKSRNTQLEWQPGVDFWRRSATLEVPIFRRGDVKQEPPIGFCAIAEEVEFKMFPFIHSWLREVFDHEYFNMCTEVTASVYRATNAMNELRATEGIAPTLRQHFSESIENIVRDLDNAVKHLIVYGLSSEELYNAFSPGNYDVVQSVGQVMSDLRKVFNDAPFRVAFDVNEDVSHIKLRRSAAHKRSCVGTYR